MCRDHSTIAALAAALLVGSGCLCVFYVSPLAVGAVSLCGLALARSLPPSAGLRSAAWLLPAIALVVAAVRIDGELQRRWPADRAEQRVLVTAYVDSLPAARAGEWVADAQVRVLRPACKAPCALRLRIAGPLGAVVPRAGERWQFVLRVTGPRARINPGGIDLERQWLLERVQGLARVVDSPLNRRLAAAAPGLLPWRERLRDNLAAGLADREARALVTALAIGDTAAMSREQWRVFSVTGTTHLVAISGMHVTLFAWVTAAFVRRLWRSAAWLQRTRRETLAMAVGVLAALGYSLLAGFSIPTQRTVAMLLCGALARMAGRELAAADVLGAAAIAVLLLDPLAPLDMGFWLSFGAMAALMLAGRETIAGWSAPLRSLVREQAWLGAALAPLTLLLFGSVSIAGLFTNFIAIPVFSFVLVPLALLGTLATGLPAAAGLAGVILQLAAAVHDPIWRLLQWLAAPGWALWSPAVPVGWYGLAALGVLLLWLPVPDRLRLTAVLALLPLVATGAVGPPAGALQLTVLDVGDGGAVLVHTRAHALLFGTGASYGTAGAAVDQHVLPALRAAGLGRLDAVVLVRANAAEVEGLARLQAALVVPRVWVGDAWPAAPPAVRSCPPAAAWSWDGIRFELRAAELAVAAGARATGACVLRLAGAGRSLLLAGTAGPADLAALAEQGAALRSLVLVGAARPGRAAAQSRWISAVQPGWIVATRARLGDAALERSAAAHGVGRERWLSPARQGALQLELGADGGLRAAPAIDIWFVPRWRVAREPLPAAVLAAPVRYDPRLTSSGDTRQCGRSCGPAVR